MPRGCEILTAVLHMQEQLSPHLYQRGCSGYSVSHTDKVQLFYEPEVIMRKYKELRTVYGPLAGLALVGLAFAAS